MLSLRLQYVFSTVTIFSIRDYNPNRPSLSLMTDLLLELSLQLDNTLLSLALHAAIVTTLSIAVVATAMMSPPRGGSHSRLEAREMVSSSRLAGWVS
jgi:hypothetical protein